MGRLPQNFDWAIYGFNSYVSLPLPEGTFFMPKALCSLAEALAEEVIRWTCHLGWRKQKFERFVILSVGLSENSVPLHPMVNDDYPY